MSDETDGAAVIVWVMVFLALCGAIATGVLVWLVTQMSSGKI